MSENLKNPVVLDAAFLLKCLSMTTTCTLASLGLAFAAAAVFAAALRKGGVTRAAALRLGSGISFANETEFDIGTSYEKLKPFLAPNSTIKIWSCDAASTYKKCSNLRNAAEALDAAIYANTGSVMSGPDGNAITRATHRIVAWIMKANTGEWKRFTPLPKIHAKGFMPGPQAFRITKEERKFND